MAKNLTSQIDKLIDDIGGSKKPSLADIRSNLVTFRTLAESLENSQSVREAEEKIAALQAALDQSEAQKKDFQSALVMANAEIKRFQAERTKQEEKEREIPPIQFQILNRLPNEHGGGTWLGIDEISRAVSIPSDETEIHIDHLEEAGLVTRRYNAYDALVWHRSMDGNKYVLAKRLAGEEQTVIRKYPDLPIIEEAMLAMMVGEDEGVNERLIHQSLEDKGAKITLEKVKWILETSLKRFADYDPEEATYGTGNTWFITDAGREYLAERDKL